MRSSLEDFTFNNRLGTGTYGTVWQAVRKQDGRTYAVKELDLRYLQKQEQAECIREVKVLSDLDSPYIIKFFDSFLDQTTLGLQHMHQKNILHRDIKSLNLLLDTNRQVKIADLGIATVLSSPKGFAKTLVGTPYYLSPELCEGKPYNEKSDVWALDRILNLPVIRAKAKQLGIDLPEPSNASGSHAHSSSAVQAPKYHPVCKGSVLTRRPSSAGVSSHAPHCFAAPDEEDTQAVRRRASESTLGTASLPGCQSGDAMPQQLPVKLPPAWRSKIAMLKSRKYGQQGNAGASVAQGAVQPAEEGTDAASAAVDQSGL
ncbi:MAG: kinase domain containing [Trebouxia sp. A1-2]|nr:MAG: kinase domain containing [Trebouxia sp. A1-2]